MLLDRVFRKFYCFVFLAATLTTTVTTARSTVRRTHSTCAVAQNTIFGKFGVRFEPFLMSHVRVRTNTFYRNGARLSFNFKTNSSNGILFYGTNEKSQHRLVTLLLRNGRLKFFAKCSSANLDIDLNGARVDDGKWHSIVFKKDGAYGTVLVDGTRRSRSYQVNCRLDYFEFGGSAEEHYRRLYQGALDYHGHYEGCIGALSFTPSVRGRVFYQSISSCQFE